MRKLLKTNNPISLTLDAEFSREQFHHVVSLLHAGRKEPSLDLALGRFFADHLIREVVVHGRIRLLMEALRAIIKNAVGYKFHITGLESALRIYFCYFNATWFGVYYCSSDYADCQVKWRGNWKRSRHFQAAPRDHGKSHIYSFENPLWHICYVDNIRILSASKSETLAEKYLGAIKRTIETNPFIREDFGDLTQNINPVDGSRLEGGRGRGGWAKNQLFCRRTNHALKDGTVESIGWGSAITGSRFDLIILDDPIEESDCRTARSRNGQKETIHILEELLEPRGKFHVIGTRKHYDDLYSYLMKNPRWTYSIDSGIIQYPSEYSYKYETDDETGKEIAVGVDIPDGLTYKVLWEDKWSIEDLLLKKHGSLPLHFLRDIQNEVTSDETSDFPEETINGCRDITVLGKRLPFYKKRPDWARWVVQGVDLSGIFSKTRATEKDSDFFNVTTLAIPHNNYDKHLIHGYRVRGIDADEQLSKIVELDYDFEPDIIVLEVNAYQKAMEGLALKKKLPVYPHNTGSEKWGFESGLPKMSMEMKNKYFVFYTGQGEAEVYYETLFAELHGLGVEAHDDSVMSLWLANLGATWLIKKHRRKMARRTSKDIKNTGELVSNKLETWEEAKDVTKEEIERARLELEERINRYM
jgi:hypothetical protein